MEPNEDCSGLPGWARVTPPRGGLDRLRQAMQKTSTTESMPWGRALGGAVSAWLLVVSVLWLNRAERQSDLTRQIISQSTVLTPAPAGLVALTGDEHSAVRMYVALPIKTEWRGWP